MQSQLTAAHYLDPAIRLQEDERLFRRLWIYAGLRSALASPHAYLTRIIGSVPVVVVERGGELRAFENVCPHRQVPIYTAEFGEQRAVCPYHGWVFDLDGDAAEGAPAGRVKTIPHAETLYRYDAAERRDLCLRRFAVAPIGQFIFVNLAEDPLPLDDQFAPEFQAQLRAASAHFGKLSIASAVDVACNWKLIHENVLDHNHVAYVHPKSFLPLLDKSQLAARGAAVPVHVPGRATLVGQSFATDSSLKIPAEPWHDAVDRYRGAGDDPDRYYNFFVYPNVNFISVGGIVFLIQQFDPIDAGHTRVRFTLALARETKRLPGLPAILWAHLKGETSVLHEDRFLLEALQSGLHRGAPRARHGNYEARLMEGAEVYLRLLGGEAAP